jgi:hypothetical protein
MAAPQVAGPSRTYPARLLFPTARSDLRFSWHPERDQFVLSLWRGDVCVGSAPLSPQEAAELSSLVVSHLGDRALWGPALRRPAPGSGRRGGVRTRAPDALERAGRWLQALGAALRRR